MTPAVRNIILSNRVAWSFMGDGSRVWDFTRASDGTRINSAGVLETIGANGLRYHFVPLTGDFRGVYVEPARTNGIRNNTMQGAVAGAPGTDPTNWTISSNTLGVSKEIVSVGTYLGYETVDVRFYGTAGATNFPSLFFDTATAIAALNGQSWTLSTALALISGSSPVVQLAWREQDSGGGLLATKTSSSFTPGAWATLVFTTASTNASTAYVRPLLTMTLTNGVVYDFTLRVGLPQMELGATITSPIRTTGSAATRAVEVLSLPVPPGIYSVEVIGGSVALAGVRYTDTVTVTGTAWDFAWPAAAITAGERHLQRVSMRRIG